MYRRCKNSTVFLGVDSFDIPSPGLLLLYSSSLALLRAVCRSIGGIVSEDPAAGSTGPVSSRSVDGDQHFNLPGGEEGSFPDRDQAHGWNGGLGRGLHFLSLPPRCVVPPLRSCLQCPRSTGSGMGNQNGRYACRMVLSLLCRERHSKASNFSPVSLLCLR